jgi:hypothetical protein
LSIFEGDQLVAAIQNARLHEETMRLARDREEALQSERNPLHGRLVPLELRPLSYRRATEFFPADDPFDDLFV